MLIAARDTPADDELPPLRDDRDTGRRAGPDFAWHRRLVWFMRILAVCWIGKGLLAWATILGLSATPLPFEGSIGGYQATVVWFSVIDLIAGVGLWLAASWGGVLWLLAVMSHMILAVFFPRFVSNGAVLLGLFIAGIMVYLTLSWLASVEEQ